MVCPTLPCCYFVRMLILPFSVWKLISAPPPLMVPDIVRLDRARNAACFEPAGFALANRLHEVLVFHLPPLYTFEYRPAGKGLPKKLQWQLLEHSGWLARRGHGRAGQRAGVSTLCRAFHTAPPHRNEAQ